MVENMETLLHRLCLGLTDSISSAHHNSSSEDPTAPARTCCPFRGLTTANVGQVHDPRHVAVPLHYPAWGSTRVFVGRRGTARSLVSKHLPNFSVPLYNEAES